MKKTLTCIECPMGCTIDVEIENGVPVSVKGNTCPRGKAYAQNEVVCPVRVVTSTVKAENGTTVPVKTEKPVKKSEIFAVMKRINEARCKLPVSIGDVIIEDVSDGVSLVATDNVER